AGLGDVSLAPRRFKTRGTPNRIYEIHVDNGIVKTSIREYPDKLKDGWQDQFTLGAGSKVAIAFNGHWERYRKLWRLVTDEKPHILWVDGDNKLQTQLWDNAESKQELDTNVVYVRALRGWKNVNFIDKDQGIVAGYIKSDGTVWYRNYCQSIDGNVWENERQLEEFTGTAISLNLFITNDYRMGFIVEDSSGKVFWYITERNWAGMAIAPETLTVAPAELDINFIPIEYIEPNGLDEYLTVAPAELELALLYADTDNDFTSINIAKTLIDENDEEYENWGWIIELTIDHPIPNLELSNVTVTNLDNSTVIQMTSIDKITDTVYRLNVSDVVESGINNVAGDIQVDITGAINPAGYTYINMTHTFIPINLVPTAIPLPEVEVIFNE
ncbi:MAG TPA: hypothetical protein VFC79_00810, partial [Tissierellaceae bacterium]|nr:hypothetical protein [Tissierellaceae bacterium]